MLQVIRVPINHTADRCVPVVFQSGTRRVHHGGDGLPWMGTDSVT